MEDIAPALLEAIRSSFKALLGDAAVTKKTYTGAAEYAERVGAALSGAFGSNLSSEVLPDGRMHWNIADRTVRPMLEQGHNLVADATAQVQQTMNEAAGIGLKAQAAPMNTEHVDSILNKLSSTEQYDDAAWILDEPVKTFIRCAVDDTLRKNVDFQGNAGLFPRIIRTAESHCCKWCSKLEGAYRYPDVPDDIYRRHNRCRCSVEYDPGDGKRQNVWTKKWTTQEERAKIETRKSASPAPEISHKAAYNEQRDLLKKYGNVENLMLTGSGEELTRWSALQSITGQGQVEILKDLQADSAAWQGLLSSQTDAFRNRLSEDTLSAISEDEKSALRMWTGSAYGNVNNYKRFGGGTDSITKANTTLMENALEKTVLKTDIYAQRGNDRHGMMAFFKEVDGWEEDITKTIGAKVSDKGFFATSPKLDGGLGGGYKMYISIPKGTHGAYIADISHAENEKELLLQAGQRFIVRDAKMVLIKKGQFEYEEPRFWLEVIK